MKTLISFDLYLLLVTWLSHIASLSSLKIYKFTWQFSSQPCKIILKKTFKFNSVGAQTFPLQNELPIWKLSVHCRIDWSATDKTDLILFYVYCDENQWMTPTYLEKKNSKCSRWDLLLRPSDYYCEWSTIELLETSGRLRRLTGSMGTNVLHTANREMSMWCFCAMRM